MNAEKALTAKRAWADLTELAQRRTVLFIASLSLLYKANVFNRSQVLDALREAGVNRDDLRRFREWKSGTEPAQ